MDVYRTHDSFLNNIESYLESCEGFEFMDYSGSKQYSDFSRAFYVFLEALDNDTLEEEDD